MRPLREWLTSRRIMVAMVIAPIMSPLLLVSLPLAFADDNKGMEGDPLPLKNKVVMSPGMRITASTTTGTITITAVDELTRSYTWEGASRSAEMIPRHGIWHGRSGLYYPGP